MSTVFQLAVWHACSHIPKGKVSTYSAIARVIGKPKAARAVGNALNANLYSFCSKTQDARLKTHLVPCHRIVCNDGRVGGYAKGTKMKIKMLKAEGVAVIAGQIVNFENKVTRILPVK